MPHKNKKETLIRQWQMLKLLGRQWLKASEIASMLKDQGHEVSVRTVQRDLQEMSTIFPIQLNDKNPRDYGWRWMKGASIDIPGMDMSEALAMRLVEIHLKQMMPSSMLEALQGVFSQAKSRLEQVPKPSDWVKKVKFVQPNQALLPPRIDENVQVGIYKALLEKRKIKGYYRVIRMEESKEYVLNPLGLILRGSVSYLVATAWDYEDPRLYAMHRFEKADVLDEECSIPEGFDLEKAISSGFADFANGGDQVHLQLLCDESKAAYLEETPLSEDQKVSSPDDGWVKISATVNDTWQLRWWLLSQGAGIEVLSPINLRKEIAKELAEASGHYATEKNPEVLKAVAAVAQREIDISANLVPRDPARIPVILDAIREKWEKNPDLRLAQLLVNVVSPSEPSPLVYYFEDEQLLSKLVKL